MLTYLYGGAKKIIWNEEEIERIDLIKLVEDNPKEYDKLASIVEKDWDEIEEKIKPKRKRRFECK